MLKPTNLINQPAVIDCMDLAINTVEKFVDNVEVIILIPPFISQSLAIDVNNDFDKSDASLLVIFIP